MNLASNIIIAMSKIQEKEPITDLTEIFQSTVYTIFKHLVCYIYLYTNIYLIISSRATGKYSMKISYQQEHKCFKIILLIYMAI